MRGHRAEQGNEQRFDLSDGPGQPPLRVLLIEDSALIRSSIVEAIDASGLLHVAAYADSSDRLSPC